MYNVIHTNIKGKTVLLKFVRQQLPRAWSFVQGLKKIAQPVDVFSACPPWWANFLLEHMLTSHCPVGEGGGLLSLAAIPATAGTAAILKLLLHD